MMIVKRIVTNIHTEQIEKAKYFYQEVLGLNLLMDQGWIATYGSDEAMKVQISFASEGGSGTPTPDLSVEVDDVDFAYKRMKESGFPIEYGPADEPWGLGDFMFETHLGN